MFPPLPESRARFFCSCILDGLRKRIPAADIHVEQEFLFWQDCPPDTGSKNDNQEPVRGMFGVLVCTDGTGREVVLKAFSGKLQGRLSVPGWAPPLFDIHQFEKTLEEHDGEIHRLTEQLAEEEDLTVRTSIKQSRRSLTDASLSAVHRLYRFHCIDGSVKSFSDLDLKKTPPTGTGDCCAPKLLDCALQHGLQPVSMAEFFYDESGQDRGRLSESFYPPCDDRCAFILPAMLGLSVVYRDESLIVVNKPAGLLSVPGRGENNQDCIVNRLRRLFPACITQPSVHRLDQDTSGLMVLAFTTEVHRLLSLQFQNGQIRKKYVALLEGKLENSQGRSFHPGVYEGRMELPFRLDPDNRPHQVYDEINGKKGITVWRKLKEQRVRRNGRTLIRTRVEFTPLTGRTHQLRLASADMHGLGIPIAGDRLYGTRENGERLMLHAWYLEFVHPVTGETLSFCNEPDF